jgi:acetylornithine/N-succinyldiaminopimelate aminotransferase
MAEGIRLVLEGVAGNRPPLSREEYDRAVAELGELRGRPLFLPSLSSGVGRGARVRLADGRWVLDLALGIGVHFFGHGDADLVRTAVAAAVEDTIMQGNLQMGLAQRRLLSLLLSHAGGRLRHGWIANSGAEANETALKIIRQKKQPATEVIAFRGCFHGRTTTMAEITDRPEYREGQPRRETVHYVPFYDARDPRSGEHAVVELRNLLEARRGRIATFVFELVQGESGFRIAPREFFAPLFEECRRADVAVWVDEIQTFGRTGELFAYQKLGLADLVDVVTIGKMLQCAATLFRDELRPGPGLVSGTFAGSTVGVVVGCRIVERLVTKGYLGPGGRIDELGRSMATRLDRLARDLGPERVRGFEGVGAMWAVEPAAADHESVVALVRRCFDAGLLVYYGGAGERFRLRLFLPATITAEELEEAFGILRRCLSES